MFLFMSLPPLSTIDFELADGSLIPIEERDDSEVLGAWGVNSRGQRQYVRIANPTSAARNPGFDVTPPELITGIITPRGVFRPEQLPANRDTFQQCQPQDLKVSPPAFSKPA